MPAENATTITFIGGGNMARAMINGLKDNDTYSLRVADPNEATRQLLSERYGIACFDENRAAIDGADVVVLAVKPQILDAVIEELAPAIHHRQLLISVAAGIRLKRLERVFRTPSAIIRAMPNTPALIGLGITGLHANAGCNENTCAVAERILSSIGEVVWIKDEGDMDAVTAVSGSGPAYIYYMIESMRDAGISAGLEPAIAAKLAVKTALGASMLASQSDLDVTELRRQVTSPGGTTEAALKSLIQEDFKPLVERAIIRATERGKELAE